MLEVGRLRLDLLARQATVDGVEVAVTTREFALLAYLMRHPRQVLSRQQILDAVWGFAHDPRSNVVDVYVGYLRGKLDGGRAVGDRDGAGDGLPPRRLMRRIGIRTRLAAVSALLAGGVLVATMSSVFLIERNAAESTLHGRARAAVVALQNASDRAPDDGVGPVPARPRRRGGAALPGAPGRCRP